MQKTRPHHIAPAIESARVVLVYKNFAARGASSLVGLGVSSMMTAKALRDARIWAEVWGVASAQQIGEQLQRAHDKAAASGAIDPTHVVIAAPWIATPDLEVLASEWPEIVFTVVSHSNFPFLQADPHAVRLLREAARLQQTTHNVFVGGVTAKFTELASRIWHTGVALLPNLYDVDSAGAQTRAPWRDGDTLRIGLFGALRVLKNPLSAVAAAEGPDGAVPVERTRRPERRIPGDRRADGRRRRLHRHSLGVAQLAVLPRARWAHERAAPAVLHRVVQPRHR
jgi:hypothetical protein